MCGIVGCVTRQASDLAAEVVMEGLSRLEYRGYDSAGIATTGTSGGEIELRKAVGKLENLRHLLEGAPLRPARAAIGHTRWATHGGVTTANAHPHLSFDGQLALIHNGIIENADAYRVNLSSHGVEFRSQTDSEVVAHLLQRAYLSLPAGGEGNWKAIGVGELDPGLEGQTAANAARLARAMAMVTRDLEGAFTLLATHAQAPGVIVAARRSSPLVVGLGEEANFLGSDVLAFVSQTTAALEIDQDEIVVVTPGGVLVLDEEGREVLHTAGREILAPQGAGSAAEEAQALVQERGYEVDFAAERVTKEGFETFMAKEIHEQPRSVAATLKGRLDAEGRLTLDELRISAEELRAIDSIIIVACGTAAYAGQVARYAIEHWCRIRCEVELAHEFRYRDPIVGPKTLVVAISQSGETMDTIMAIRHAREQGARVLAIVNTPGSTISRESDAVLLTHAGPEIAVASTKAFTAQLAACYVLGLYLAQVRGNKYADEIADYMDRLTEMPARIQSVLDRASVAKQWGRELQNTSSVIFLGRHVGFPVALEGALKLKEIAYMHAEGFAAGELKHGPIALIEEGQVVVIIVPTPRRPELHRKVVSNIQEVRARGAQTIVIAEEGDASVDEFADAVFRVPSAPTLFRPLVDVVPLQLLACEVASARGLDVDQPRNLAKSVTVE